MTNGRVAEAERVRVASYFQIELYNPSIYQFDELGTSDISKKAGAVDLNICEYKTDNRYQ